MFKFVKGLMLSCSLWFLGYGLWWCLVPAHFPINHVHCKGALVYQAPAQIKTIVLPEIAVGFFRLKVFNLQKKLLALPWIEQASIKRVWPDQLEIQLKEQVPFANWRKGGLLSQGGVLYHPQQPRTQFANLPVLGGPEGKHALVWRQFLTMQSLLDPVNLKIVALDLAPRGAWQLKLSNNIVVFLGTNDILSRLKFFANAYEKCLCERQSEIAYVDLRYTKGMSVGWLVL